VLQMKSHLENIKVVQNKNYFGLINQLDPNDNRIPIFINQIKERGFDSTELWNLDYTIALFILPRLKVFREAEAGHPGSLTQVK